MIKAAFFDIDGTLLSHRTNTVPPSARQAIEALRQKGILVFLATGRHISILEELPQLQDLRYDGAITLNGAYCYDQQGLIYGNPICREDIRILLDFLEINPMPCGFIEARSMYINFHDERVAKVHAAIHSPLPQLGDLQRGLDRDIYQILMYLTSDEIPKLPPLPHCKITKWHNDGIDVIPVSGGKAIGIQKVLEHYGIRKEETIAFGDGDNDIDMFHAVQIAVAMGNSADKVKAESTYTTDAVDDDGILHALEHFGLV